MTRKSSNRKRKAEAETKPLTCCAPECGVSFWDAGHLIPAEVEEHRRDGGRVVCGSCVKLGVTARGVADAAKRLNRQLKCGACEKEFPRQDHISDRQESDHFTRKSKVVCADCVGLGFTARNCQAYECFGACKRKLPKSKFTVGPHFARALERRTLKCKACA